MFSGLYHVPTQPASLVLVGINFALGLTILDNIVLINFLLFLGAAEELPAAPDVVEFAPALELLLACGRLPPFSHVHRKDSKAFWNSLAESLANLLLI